MVQNKEKMVKIITVASIIFIVILLTSLVLNLVKIANLNNQKNHYTKLKSDLDAVIEYNDDTINFMESDNFVDQYAREYLDMIGKGEVPYEGK